MSKNNDTNHKSAFIVWTPLHIYNAIRYVLTSDHKTKFDLFFIGQTKSMYNSLKVMMSVGLWDDIFVTEISDVRNKQKFWEYVSLFVSPQIYVKHIFGKDAINNRYEKIYYSVPTRLNDAIIRSNYYNELVGYDDGIGSYYRDIYGLSLGKKYDWFNTIFRNGYDEVKTVLLNSPRFRCKCDEKTSYMPIISRPLTKKEKSIVKKVLSFKALPNYPKIVYLSQPIELDIDDGVFYETEKNILGVLNGIDGSDFIVRLHPREINPDRYSAFRIDYGDNSWELMCDDIIENDSILISTISTAQFIPKLLFNKEPTILFTIGIYDKQYGDIIGQDLIQLVERFKNAYSDNSKVMFINNLLELEENIRKYISKNDT